MVTGNTNMSCNWIILILLHEILAAQSKKLKARTNLHSQDEKYVQAKMDALIKTQFGHYENNFEYWYFFTELIVIRQSEKPLTAKESEIEKFQKYNNRRLDLEEQMESRVSHINFEMLSLPHGHKCKKFYLQQKLALERAYTKKNSVKQNVVRKNRESCPFKNNFINSISIEVNNNNNHKFIFVKIDAEINSALGYYQNNREYSEHLSDLIIAKEIEASNSEKLLALKKFQKYNRRRLDLEERIQDRVIDIEFEIESLPPNHKCMRFYLKQKLILERSYTKKNSVKKQIFYENSKSCPNQDQETDDSTNNTSTTTTVPTTTTKVTPRTRRTKKPCDRCFQAYYYDD